MHHYLLITSLLLKVCPLVALNPLTATNLVRLVLAVHLAVAVEGLGDALVARFALPLVVPYIQPSN